MLGQFYKLWNQTYMNMHIVTPIHVGKLSLAVGSNVYEHEYRHTNTCWDNFKSYRIKCI